MSDVIIQAQSTLFQRQGQTFQYKQYSNMPVALVNLLNALYQNSVVGQQVSLAEQAALYALLIQNSEIIPGGVTLYNVQALDPTLYPGAGNLQEIYQQDPFSTTYETNTQATYARSYATARSAAQSGPTNVRGGTARQGFELAELDTLQSIQRFREIWQNQLAMAQLVVQSVQLANQSEGQRRADQLRAQQQQAATEQGRVMQTLSAAEQVNRDRETHLRSLSGGAEFLGAPLMLTTETLNGQGFQGAVNTSFGMSYWR